MLNLLSEGKISVKQIALLRMTRRRWGVVLMLLVVLIVGVTPAMAAAETPASDVVEQDPEAKEILMKMAGFLAEAPAFSMTLRSSYDAIQENGQSIEFGEQRRILLQRPDRLRVETQRSDGEQALLLFDGKQIIAFKADDNVYVRVEKTGTVDDALVYAVRDLQFILPMARLLHTGFPQQIEKRLTAISYVEENTLFDVVTDHLAIRSEDVDIQLWVTQGDQPLLRRIVLTYKNAPGQPQFRGEFSEWSFSPEINTDSFSFTPPADAEQVPLIARVRQKGSLPAQEGDRK